MSMSLNCFTCDTLGIRIFHPIANLISHDFSAAFASSLGSDNMMGLLLTWNGDGSIFDQVWGVPICHSTLSFCCSPLHPSASAIDA